MAAPILAYESLGLVQGSGWLFRGLDLYVGARDRLALIGRNGAGKTTLLKLIAGQIDSDEGRRTIVPGTKVVLLEQDPRVDGYARLEDFVLAGDDAPARYEAEAIAGQLGIDLSRDAASASGGERRRAAIVRALAQNPDVLLLDEPTNHLDIAAIDWLEEWLGRFKGAFIAISHDRTFLTRLTRQTLWLDRGAVRRAEIGFGGFEAWTETVYAEEARNAERLDAKLKIEEHWLQRGVTGRRRAIRGGWRSSRTCAPNARRCSAAGRREFADGQRQCPDQDRHRRRARDQAVWRPHDHRRSDATHNPRRPHRNCRRQWRGQDDLAQTPDRRTRARQRQGEIGQDARRRGHRPAAQVDGAGKERARGAGRWWRLDRGARYPQAHSGLSQGIPVRTRAGRCQGRHAVGRRALTPVAGARIRPAFHLLVLDEPTNDLDLETLDLLQEVIADYDGTVLIVSHDRDFLDRTVTVTLGLDGSGKVDVVAGGYEDWERKRAMRDPARRPAAKAMAAPPPSPSRAKLTYKDQRDYDLLPKRIEEIDRQIARDEATLADPALYSAEPKRFATLTAAIAAARAEKDAAELRWLELAEQVEAIA